MIRTWIECSCMALRINGNCAQWFSIFFIKWKSIWAFDLISSKLKWDKSFTSVRYHGIIWKLDRFYQRNRQNNKIGMWFLWMIPRHTDVMVLMEIFIIYTFLGFCFFVRSCVFFSLAIHFIFSLAFSFFWFSRGPVPPSMIWRLSWWAWNWIATMPRVLRNGQSGKWKKIKINKWKTYFENEDVVPSLCFRECGNSTVETYAQRKVKISTKTKIK